MTNPPQAIPLTAGFESDVYQVNIDDFHLILKVSHSNGKQQYDFEAFAYSEAVTSGVLAPHVMYVDADSLLMTQLSGKEMDDRTDLFNNKHLFSLIATDLAHCHSIKLQGFGNAIQSGDTFRGSYNHWKGFLESVQTFDLLQAVGSLSSDDIQLLKRFWNDKLTSIELAQGSLIHGDFAMSAIFVDETEYTGLIDFVDAIIGDPLMDLAYFRFKEVTKPYGQNIYNHLADAYRSSTQKTIDENRILFYMIYWGLRRLNHCPDETLRIKFGDKLHAVTQLIKESANQ